LYKKRIRITIETFLIEASLRAKELAEKGGEPKVKYGAYCHIVGLGLGVWELVFHFFFNCSSFFT
jgi:hypothetical protein